MTEAGLSRLNCLLSRFKRSNTACAIRSRSWAVSPSSRTKNSSPPMRYTGNPVSLRTMPTQCSTESPCVWPCAALNAIKLFKSTRRSEKAALGKEVRRADKVSRKDSRLAQPVRVSTRSTCLSSSMSVLSLRSKICLYFYHTFRQVLEQPPTNFRPPGMLSNRCLVCFLVLFLAILACNLPTSAPPTLPALPPSPTPEAILPTSTPGIVYQPIFELAPCAFPVPSGYNPECGYLIVPENRARIDSPM